MLEHYLPYIYYLLAALIEIKQSLEYYLSTSHWHLPLILFDMESFFEKYSLYLLSKLDFVIIYASVSFAEDHCYTLQFKLNQPNK